MLAFLLLLLSHAGEKPADGNEPPADADARALEQLKETFLRHHRKGDVDAVMAMFHLKGASRQVVGLYRYSVPRAESEPVESARVLELGDDYKTDIPHTLTPERVLLLKFRKKEGQSSIERFFYIGRYEGKFYFTLPKDE